MMNQRVILSVSSLILIMLLLSVTFVTGSTITAQSGTYYVATDGVDDPGNGSAASPWATITYALGRVPDGSLILVRPGTDRGSQRDSPQRIGRARKNMMNRLPVRNLVSESVNKGRPAADTGLPRAAKPRIEGCP